MPDLGEVRRRVIELGVPEEWVDDWCKTYRELAKPIESAYKGEAAPIVAECARKSAESDSSARQRITAAKSKLSAAQREFRATVDDAKKRLVAEQRAWIQEREGLLAPLKHRRSHQLAPLKDLREAAARAYHQAWGELTEKEKVAP